MKRTGFWAAVAASVLMGTALAQEPEDETGAADAAAETEAGVAPETAGTEPPAAADPFARDSFRLRPIACPFRGRFDYDDERTSCQLLQVPENRAAIDPRMIELLVVTLTATEPEDWDAAEKGEWVRRDDPVIFLQGGPGGPSAGLVEGFETVPGALMRDLILLEQRGIGYSDELCPYFADFDPEAANAATLGDYAEAQLDALRVCAETAMAAGVDLAGYSNNDNARDVVALRRAMGLDSWNLWGISYGSTLALELLRIDPEGIRATIIDGIAPVDVPEDFGAFGKHYARALGEMQAICDADGQCAESFPAIADDVRAAIASVKAAPLVIDEPLSVELYPSGSATVFADTVAGLPFTMLYASEWYPAFPATVAAMRAAIEDGSAADRFRVITSGGFSLFDGFGAGMNFAVTCQLGWNDKPAELFAEDSAAHPELAALSVERVVRTTPELCRDYGVPPRQPTPLLTDVPTLVANGQVDPITPPAHAEFILPRFSRAQYVEVPYGGHGPTADEESCAYDAMHRFLDAPGEAVDLSCLIDDAEAPVFWKPLWRTQGVTRLAVDLMDEGKQAFLLGGAGTVSALGFLLISAGGLARLLNPARFSAAAPTGGARILTGLAALLATVGVAGVGYAAYSTFEESLFTLLFGLPHYARWAAASLLAGGAFSVLALLQLVRHLFAPRLPLGTFFGLLLSNVAVLATWVLAVMAGFAPWAG